MPTYSARAIRKPRKHWHCDSCHRCLSEFAHVVMYGCADEGDKPYNVRWCVPCVMDGNDAKAQTAAREIMQ